MALSTYMTVCIITLFSMKYNSRYSFLLDVQVFLVQKQPNGSDRGVFAEAFTTYLAYGIHPETVQLMSPKREPIYLGL